MTEREPEGGLRPEAARWLGFDTMCQCGHDNGLHMTPGTECAVFGCDCGHFRAEEIDESPQPRHG